MRGRWAAVVGAGVLAAAALAAATGCGGAAVSANQPVTARTIAHGRELFQTGTAGKERCAFCHTLAAAKATGPFGPSLDAEGNEYRTQLKWSDRRIRAFVLHQIAHPTCENPQDPSRCMPTNLVTGDDAFAVAAFVGHCVARSGKSGCKPTAGGMRGLAGRGQALFTSLGCFSCHWAEHGPPVGPTFHGLYGSKVELQSGMRVNADDNYLFVSILAPDAQIVKGYPRGFMSGRISSEHISVAQARALVAYIKTQK